MKKILIFALLSLLLLSGCSKEPNDGGGQPDDLVPRPNVLQPQSPSKPAEGSEQEKEQSMDSQTEVRRSVNLVWETMQEGEWPLNCTMETLQFVGGEDEELEHANEELRSNSDSEYQYYQDCVALSDEERFQQGATWADIWAYPVSGERYLNAVWSWRRMYFHTEVDESWNQVGSIVYDMAENRIISLDEALESMAIDQGDMERAVCEFVAQQQIGIYEKLSSLAFYMGADEMPVFMIGAIVNRPELSIPWTTFFTWTDGEVEWIGEHPLPLYLVDTEHQDELSCFRDMGQYDGAAVISEEEAADILGEIYEVQEYLAQGMQMMMDGTAEWINEEYSLCIALGTDNGDHFVREVYYGVSYSGVYRMNELTGEWKEVGFG